MLKDSRLRELREKNLEKQRNLIQSKKKKTVRPIKGDLLIFKEANKGRRVPLKEAVRSLYSPSTLALGTYIYIYRNTDIAF